MEYSNLELFYDCLDESIEIIYEQTHESYFQLFFATVKNIINCEVTEDYPKEVKDKLMKLYSKLSTVDFTTEDIRKALQSIIMKGFKEEGLPNIVTPDTLGFLIAYLISRLLPKGQKTLNILDPICGTGNLLYSIENHLELDIKLFASDHNELYVKLCKSFSDLTETPVELFLQDTLNLKLRDMDVVVFDAPVILENKDTYFPYDLVLHHIESLKENGIMIGILPNDFFSYDKDSSFKGKLYQNASIYGIIELPDDFFKANPKSIIIFKKCKMDEDNKKCLMVKLPSFDDIKGFNEALYNVEAWFEKNKN